MSSVAFDLDPTIGPDLAAHTDPAIAAVCPYCHPERAEARKAKPAPSPLEPLYQWYGGQPVLNNARLNQEKQQFFARSRAQLLAGDWSQR